MFISMGMICLQLPGLGEDMQIMAKQNSILQTIEAEVFNIKKQAPKHNDYLVKLEKKYGNEVYSKIIYQLTRIQVPPRIAQQHLINVISHMQALSKAVGRDIGFCVACYDYFINVIKYIKNPVLIEEWQLKEKENSADKDELTGLFNRRYFNQQMHQESEKFRRFGSPFSLLMIDIDHFKRFNDTNGHQAGDEVLKIVADVLTRIGRAYDKVTRYGGEEFAVILPLTTRKDAANVAERLRTAIEKQRILFAGKDLGHVTVSIGIATCPIDSLDKTMLVQRADQALYVAKRTRNAVVAYCEYNRRNPEIY
jgi:diguanylate cyclase (GGDEF)-like protein